MVPLDGEATFADLAAKSGIAESQSIIQHPRPSPPLILTCHLYGGGKGPICEMGHLLNSHTNCSFRVVCGSCCG